MPVKQVDVKYELVKVSSNPKVATKQLESIGSPSKALVDLGTPVYPDFSPSSSVSTPSSSQGQGHGRQRKEKTSSYLDYSDFPFDGTCSEQEKWFKAKRTSVWRFNVLNSEQEEAFCVKEREHTLKYYYEQKLKKSQQNQGVDADQGDDLEGVQYLEVDNEKDKKAQDKEAHTKELSRER